MSLHTTSYFYCMKSPFKFLDSYTKDDRDIFFGRDRECNQPRKNTIRKVITLIINPVKNIV